MKKYFLILGVLFAAIGCQKTGVRVYEIQNQPIKQDEINKKNFKKELEFVSLAYADLYQKPIGSDELQDAVQVFNANGDKALVVDLLIRDWLNRPEMQLPTNAQMRQNTADFVVNTYKKFYHRSPNEFEKWHWVNRLNTDNTLGADMVYYAFLISDEYKWF